jgi:hypothetical protein
VSTLKKITSFSLIPMPSFLCEEFNVSLITDSSSFENLIPNVTNIGDVTSVNIKNTTKINSEAADDIILVTNKILDLSKIPSSLRVLILVSPSSKIEELKHFWIQCYLKKILLLLAEEQNQDLSFEKLLYNAFIQAFQWIQTLESQHTQKLIYEDYEKGLRTDLHHQAQDLRKHLQDLRRKKQDLKKIEEENKTLQKFALKILSCHSLEELENLTSEFFKDYIPPQGKILINECQQRLLSQSESFTYQEMFVKILQSLHLPALIINANYDVIISNFEEKDETSKYNQKCYQLLFKKETPCSGCQLGETFFSQNKSTLVISNSIHLKVDKSNDSYFFNLYQNDQDLLLHKIQVSESQKLYDIGVISASIAHELNNPLAGMLSYTQFLQMNPHNEPGFSQDLDLIESSIQKARDIINQLLIFARKHTRYEKDHLASLMEATLAMAALPFYQKTLPQCQVQFALEEDLNHNELLFATYLIQSLASHLFHFETTSSDSIHCTRFSSSSNSNDSNNSNDSSDSDSSYVITLGSKVDHFFVALSPVCQDLKEDILKPNKIKEAISFFQGETSSTDKEFRMIFPRSKNFKQDFSIG